MRMVQANYGEEISVIDSVWCNDHRVYLPKIIGVPTSVVRYL